MSWIVCKWLRWRYGGNVYRLKPPLGYYKKESLLFILRYYVLYLLWMVENLLFKWFGKDMRDKWLDDSRK